MIRAKSAKSVARASLLFVASVAVVFVIFEGLSSSAIVAHDVLTRGPASRLSQYDSLLGWGPVRGAYFPDFFGPAKYVRFNAGGFRADEPTAVTAPEGKIRIICSGDSFTFGQGVANDRTWCHLLSQLDPWIETPNLGYPGYGVDQAFLRYRRSGTAIDHDIHLFAFVEGDFNRMSRTAHHGLQKPILRLEGSELTVGNVPVSQFKTRVALRLQTASEGLRSVDFLRRVWRRVPWRPVMDSDRTMDKRVQKTGPVARAVFMELDRLARRRGAVVVFVFFPTAMNLERDTRWHQWFRATIDSLGFGYVDLTAPMRAVPRGQTATFFIPRGSPDQGHYTEAGNAWVAEVLLAELQQIPEVHDALDRNRSHREDHAVKQ
jgi:hypothetical protein